LLEILRLSACPFEEGSCMICWKKERLCKHHTQTNNGVDYSLLSRWTELLLYQPTLITSMECKNSVEVYPRATLEGHSSYFTLRQKKSQLERQISVLI
jgi:hypothetical protein